MRETRPSITPLHVQVSKGLHRDTKMACVAQDLTLAEAVAQALIMLLAKGGSIEKRPTSTEEEVPLFVRIPTTIYDLLEKTCNLENLSRSSEKLGKVDYVDAALKAWLRGKSG